MTNKPKHKIYHEVSFYIALASVIGVFFTSDNTLQWVLLAMFVSNTALAQAVCNRNNIKDLYKEKEDEKD